MDEHIDMMSNHIALDKIEIKRGFFLSGTKPGFILFLVLFSLNTQGLYLSLNWTDRNVSRNIGGNVEIRILLVCLRLSYNKYLKNEKKRTHVKTFILT